VIFIDVANGHDIAKRTGLHNVAMSLAADADPGDPQPLVRRTRMQISASRCSHPKASPGQGAGLQKLSARWFGTHISSSAKGLGKPFNWHCRRVRQTGGKSGKPDKPGPSTGPQLPILYDIVASPAQGTSKSCERVMRFRHCLEPLAKPLVCLDQWLANAQEPLFSAEKPFFSAEKLLVSAGKWLASAEEPFVSAEKRFISAEKPLVNAEEWLVSANQ
jgi:hypothetical protein